MPVGESQALARSARSGASGEGSVPVSSRATPLQVKAIQVEAARPVRILNLPRRHSEVAGAFRPSLRGRARWGGWPLPQRLFYRPSMQQVLACAVQVWLLLAGTLWALLLAGCSDGNRVASPALEFKQPSFERIVIVVLENENEPNAIEQPFMKRLAARGAYFSSFEAITHPSQPNYIAMVAGDVHGVGDDSNVDLDVRHLGDLLEARGLRWKVYAEGYPGKCRLDQRIGPYVRRHVPFLSFKNVQSDPARCANIVNASELYDDIAAGTLPEYALYIPDRNNDGHDTDVGFADRWLETTFGPLLDDPRFMQDTLFVVTFDESKHFGGNRIYTAFYGDSVIAGTISEHPWNHYSVLRTIEESFQLGTLGLNDQSAEPISGIWR